MKTLTPLQIHEKIAPVFLRVFDDLLSAHEGRGGSRSVYNGALDAVARKFPLFHSQYGHLYDKRMTNFWGLSKFWVEPVSMIRSKQAAWTPVAQICLFGQHRCAVCNSTDGPAFNLATLKRNMPTTCSPKCHSLWKKEHMAESRRNESSAKKKRRARRLEETCMSRYGVTRISQVASVREKHKATKAAWSLERCAEVRSKHKASSFGTKEVVHGGHRWSNLQGFEDRAIRLLLDQGVHPSRVQTDGLPVFRYRSRQDNRDHSYHPDIEVKPKRGTNVPSSIIEVKSTYTAGLIGGSWAAGGGSGSYEQLRDKSRAVIDAGHRFFLFLGIENGDWVVCEGKLPFRRSQFLRKYRLTERSRSIALYEERTRIK